MSKLLWEELCVTCQGFGLTLEVKSLLASLEWELLSHLRYNFGCKSGGPFEPMPILPESESHTWGDAERCSWEEWGLSPDELSKKAVTNWEWSVGLCILAVCRLPSLVVHRNQGQALVEPTNGQTRRGNSHPEKGWIIIR